MARWSTPRFASPARAALALACMLVVAVPGDFFNVALPLLIPLVMWVSAEPLARRQRISGGTCVGLALLLTWLMYVVARGLATRGRVWISHDDPMQLWLQCMYLGACALVPTGVVVFFARAARGRLAGLLAIGAWTLAWAFGAPSGPRNANALTDVARPAAMNSSMRHDGRWLDSVRDDLAVIAAFACIGFGLHVLATLRHRRSLARTETSPAGEPNARGLASA